MGEPGRRRRFALVGGACVGVLAATLAGVAARGAEPASGTVSPTSPVVWQGSVLASSPMPPGTPAGRCVSPDDPRCDRFRLTVDGPDETAPSLLTITVSPSDARDDLDLYVFGASGELITGSATSSGSERVVIADPPDATYTVAVYPWLATPGATYEGRALLDVDVSGTSTDPEIDCNEFVPEAASVAGVTDGGQAGELRLLVLLNGVSESAMREHIALASKRSYEPLGLSLVPARFDTVFVPSAGTRYDAKNDVTLTLADYEEAMAAAKRHVGGRRPAGFDLVYLATSKDLTGPSYPGLSEHAVAGVADCIGGIRSAQHAFAIGEVHVSPWRGTLSPAVRVYDGSASVMAHELGHLLGAHHHLANCAEGVADPGAEQSRQPEPCTLMFNVAGPSTFRFSSLNGAIVRGHALRYASSDAVSS